MNLFNMTIQITLILKLFSTLTTRVSFPSMHSLNMTVKVTFSLEYCITLVTIMGVYLHFYFVHVVSCL